MAWVRPVLFMLAVLSAVPAAAQCEGRAYRVLLNTTSGFPASAKSIDDALASGQFIDRFASYIDSRFNKTQGLRHGQRAAYYVTSHVLASGLPWSEVFVGHFNLPNRDYPSVEVDPKGIGFFTSPGWVERYAGNEKNGLMLVAANRILQNTIGLVRVAAANNSAPGVPNDAAGRRAAACTGCHFAGPYGLDDVAQLLPIKKVGPTGAVTFEAPAVNEPRALLNTQIRNERELVETLVASDAFKFWSCRLAFEFVYGRAEYSCEAPAFDRCVDALTSTGQMQAAVKSLITEPDFCR